MKKLDVIEKMMELFRGNETHHGTHGTPKIDDNGLKWTIRSTAKTIKSNVTAELWSEHLSGNRPLGIVPINSENKCWWGSIDVDEYDTDILEIVGRAQSYPLVPCRSKSGGLHLFLFVTEAVEAAEMQSALRTLAAALGLGQSEIFPKQINLIPDRGDHGSWIIMPYYGDDFGGKLKMQYGLKKTGAEMTINEFITTAINSRVTPEELAQIKIKGKSKNRGGTETSDFEEKEGGKRKRIPFSDGPPCLMHLASLEGGIQQGGQNNSLFQMGVYYKRAKPQTWQTELEKANQKFMIPPLPSSDVESVIKSLNKKDYQYKCKDQPMVNHCDAMKCRMRKYGVGPGGVYPEITSLNRYPDAEPVVWVVGVENVSIEMSTEDLQNYMRFHRLCMEHAQKCYAMVRQDVWLGMVAEAMQNMQNVSTSLPKTGDMGVNNQFFELLNTFLTNKQRGQKEEDLLSGRPWEDEERGVYVITIASLEKYVHREGLKDLKRPRMIKYLRDTFEAKWAKRELKGKHINSWEIPKSKIDEIMKGGIDTPEIKRSPI